MHLTEQQINDYVDDALSAAEIEAARTHIEACSECREEVETLRSLLARVASLPQSIEPDRDLRPQSWPQPAPHTLWHWRYPLAAAAVLLIAVTSLVTIFMMRDAYAPTVRVTEIA